MKYVIYSIPFHSSNGNISDDYADTQTLRIRSPSTRTLTKPVATTSTSTEILESAARLSRVIMAIQATLNLILAVNYPIWIFCQQENMRHRPRFQLLLAVLSALERDL